ncbi:MAG TPA: PBP1A family penicillin-binding protein [Candidatus Polarisedimenticolaceae bacterium]|nr:PBP1A family penicillin-binding protein [Candidatus Polarisedimenticolaceae bacterium]
MFRRKPRSGDAGRSRRWLSGRRLRLALALGTFLVVVAGGTLLFVYVEVTSQFEGRLWQLPSRIYSSALTLGPGDRLTAEQLAARLDRCGYARTAGAPEHPGQYRRRGNRVELHVRAFSTGGQPSPARRLVVRFAGGGVESLEDGAGHALRAAQLEPELLATLYGARQEERELVRVDELPQRFVQAVLAAEDARFFEHAGVSLRSILRAAAANLQEGRVVQGGSTITQQTVKNLFLGQQRTWWRKIREAPMSLVLDARYSKERILEVYLNDAYLGQRGAVSICGVGAAARFYFGRDVRDLTLSESALLAGLIRSPGSYNPFAHRQQALERRDQVLDAMVHFGFIPEEEARAARAQKLQLASGSGGFARGSYVVDFVRGELSEVYSSDVLNRDDLRVYTTLDTELQENAEAALEQGLARLERDVPSVRQQARRRTLQGAVIVTEPESGAILAMVGGRDYRRTQFNRVAQAKRQPGSCFKPFIYAAGFERGAEGQGDGLTTATLLDDSPLEMRSGGKLWAPANYDGEFRGPVTARRALEESLNVPTVRAAQQTGLEHVIDLAKRCGIGAELSAVPSLALGTQEVTPLELITAYSAFANQGTRVRPWIVRQVTDRQGKVLLERRVDRARAISPQVAYLVTHVLRGVFLRGTARSAANYGFYEEAAGKTGTTDDTRDAWFVGYVGRVLGLVWVGYDENVKSGLTGATGALPIWVDVMKRSVRSGESCPAFEEPPGIVHVGIDPESGERAVAGCPLVDEEVFIEGSEPADECHLHMGSLRRWWRRLTGRSTRDL